MANKPEEFPQFTVLSEQTINERTQKLAAFMSNIPHILEISDIQVNSKSIAQIIDKVEKRRIYFHIFHNGMKMGELNEFSLYCFWILKLCPFKHSSIDNSELNAKISLRLFIDVIHSIASRQKKKANYSFRYRDLSKESIMLLAESLIS
jgi:hypothetical protein